MGQANLHATVLHVANISPFMVDEHLSIIGAYWEDSSSANSICVSCFSLRLASLAQCAETRDAENAKKRPWPIGVGPTSFIDKSG